MQAVGYIRVSTARQAEAGLSLDAQRQGVTAYCALDGLELTAILDDEGESAKNLAGRPGMCRLLELIDASAVRHVVVLKMDRMFRSVRDALEVFGRMERAGVEFHSVREKIDTSTAVGRFFRTTMLAMAEFEREQVGERTSAVLRATKGSPGGNCILDHRRREGKLLVGQAPYGWRWNDKELIAHPQEMPVAIEIRELRSAGESYAGIERWLASAGIPTRTGKAWSRMTLHRICVADYYPDAFSGDAP